VGDAFDDREILPRVAYPETVTTMIQG